MVGSDHRRVLPVGVLFGASFMVAGRPAGPDHRLPPGDADRGHHRVHRRPDPAGPDPAPPLPVRGHPVSLQLRGGLRRHRRPAHRVRRRHLAVPDGQFVGLLGPNGSGKSTLLKAIYRVHRPAAGRVLLDGVDLLALPARDAARRVAVVAQETTVEFDFTVVEMVMIGRTPHKRAFERDNDHDRADRRPTPSSGSAVSDLAHRSFNTLSGGEKQRVADRPGARPGRRPPHPGRAHQPPRHPLPDRGAGAGRRPRRHRARRPARPEPGRPVLRHRPTCIADGQIVTGGPPAKVITAETIRHAYGADVLVIDHPDTGTPHLIPPPRSRPAAVTAPAV